jgi:hypothetical protein
MKNPAFHPGRLRPRRLSLLVALAAGQAVFASGAACAAPGESLGAQLLSEAALERAVQRGELPGREGAPPQPASGPQVASVKPAGGVAPDDTPDKSYGIPAAEILGFQVALNRFDHAFAGPDYGVSVGSIRRNLHSSWEVDQDPFAVNQLGHPYAGSIYFNAARSNGLSFWESMGYAFAGSAVWETAGETTPPSRNDQITTSFGGTFLGEALYRMASLVLEEGYGLDPGARELTAGALSPMLFFNRYVRPGRTSGVFTSNHPALYSRLQLGVSTAVTNQAGPSQGHTGPEAAADFLLDYGLPGKAGYEYRRPFDYFSFQLRASTAQGVESLGTRGLLVGAPYAEGRDLRGIFGIYGSYDYLSPQIFRVASTAVSLGSNAQWRVADRVVLQAHASGGVGYTSTGTVRPNADKLWNYGFAPEAMFSGRLILGDRLLFDTTVHEFFDGKLSSSETGGTDRVFRADASLTYRLASSHAIALKYISSRRRIDFPGISDVSQRRDTLGLYYVYEAVKGFGAVDW